MEKCDFDPVQYKGAAMGMFHCPECGQMVLAGMPHPQYWLDLEGETENESNIEV